MSQTQTTQITAQSIGQILSTLRLPKPLTPASKPSATQSKTADTAKDCNLCQGIDHCQFPYHRGYRPILTNRGSSIEECPHLAKWKLQRRAQNLIQAAGIPQKYCHLTFNDFHLNSSNCEAFTAAIDLNSLYIHGAANSGKTLLLSLIGNEHTRQGTQVQYITTAELILRLNYNSDACEQRLRHFQETPVLLLDDLGLERHSEFAEEQLYMVLEGRARQCRTTVIAGKLRIADLDKYYSEHVARRIAQCTEREAHLTIQKTHHNPTNKPLNNSTSKPINPLNSTDSTSNDSV